MITNKHLKRTKVAFFKLKFNSSIASCLLLTAALAPCQQIASAAELPVALGSAGNFSVLAGSTVTSSGETILNGDLGLWPGSSVSGFPPGTVNGTSHVADPTAQGAQRDLTTAFNNAAGRSTAPISIAGNIGGRTLRPGLYKSTSSLEISSGNLTLDGQGDPNAVFIFQIATTLVTTSGRQVILIGSASAKNVFWQVGTSATIGTTSAMKGTIMADQSISLKTGARLNGRALARIGGVTLEGNGVTISRPGGAASVFTSCNGPYHGLFYDTAAGVQLNSSGFVRIGLQEDGSFNGYLVVSCDTNPISGKFDATSRTAMITLPNLTVLLELDCSGPDSKITGTVTRPNWQASLEADLRGFDFANPVPADLRGHYTLVIPPDLSTPNSPAGAGYGSLSLPRAGTVDLIGRTSDGKSLKQFVPISADGDWPLFACLYQGRGSLLGWMKFTEPGTLDNSLTSWIKPSGGTSYPDGFAVETTIRASRYLDPAPGTRILDFSSAVLVFTGGNLPADLVCPVWLTRNNAIMDQSGHGVIMDINQSAGVFSGSFKPPGQNRRLFEGAVLQSSNAGWGYFIGRDLSGHVYFGPR